MKEKILGGVQPTPSEKSEIKTNYITILSVISMFFVVCIHQNFAWTGFSTERWWLVSTILRGICYPAVPIFFMIAGANLMDYKKKYDTKTFFKKRAIKILIPFIAWSVIAIIYRLATQQVLLEELSVKTVLNGIINTSTKFNDTLWFIPAYISIMLAMPLFASIDEKYKKRVLFYLAIVWFAFDCCYPFINSIFKINISIPLTTWPLRGYIFYSVIGYLLHNHELSKKSRYIIYLLGLIAMLSMTVGTYFYSIGKGKIDETFLGSYVNLPVCVYAIALFVFVKNASKYILKSNIISKILGLIGKYTFAIYLAHNLVRNFFVVILHVNTISLWWRTIGVIPVVTVCILIAWVLRKIPIVKKIVP